MADAQIISHVDDYKEAFTQAIQKALEECGLIAESYAKGNCPVDTGQLRNSITHEVDAAEGAVYIGTNMEYGVYVELGTGQYAPGGRPTPWVYEDAKGNFHTTNGMAAKPYLKPAVEDNVDTYRQIFNNALKG